MELKKTIGKLGAVIKNCLRLNIFLHVPTPGGPGVFIASIPSSMRFYMQ